MAKCPKCKKKLRKGAKFCIKCGHKLETKKIEGKKEKKNKVKYFDKKRKSLFIILYIVIGIVVFLLIFPTKTYSYEIEIPYEATETYTVKEPYETQEAYQKQEAYQSTETYTDTVPVEKDVPYQDTEYRYTLGCDSDSACTCLHWSWFGLGDCDQCAYTVTKYRKETFYEDIQKERPATKYKTVTAYRTVTAYKDVEKTRTVMKTKTETKYKEENWIFGFKLPWKLHIF